MIKNKWKRTLTKIPIAIPNKTQGLRVLREKNGLKGTLKKNWTN
jgi:hypothetical protein